MQCAYAVPQVAAGYKFWMLTRHQQEVAEALTLHGARLLNDFIERESDAQDGVVARKAAVLAIVDTLIRQVERSEKANHFPNPWPRNPAGPAAKGLTSSPTAGRHEIAK